MSASLRRRLFPGESATLTTAGLWYLLLLLALAACRQTQPEQEAANRQPTRPETGSPELVTMAPTSPRATLTPTEPLRATTTTPAGTAPASMPPTVGAASLPSPTPFPADFNPLTGESVADPIRLRRRPLAVKVSNAARVRPQHGLNSADLVYEHLSEGGITRFTAIFYSQDAPKVGSIRSARLIDLEIPVMYDAAFAYSGSSAPIKSMIRAGTFFDRVISPDFGHAGFYRESTPGLRVEDTMFTDTFVLRSLLQQRGVDSAPRLSAAMAFADEPPPGGRDASFAEIRYGATNAYWYYDAGLGRYLRWSDGVRHLDAASGEQLSFKNILIVRAHHQPTEIIEDSLGSPSLQIQIWGRGPLQLFRDGLSYEGYWQRETAERLLTFYDEQGNPLPLAPGNSFIHLAPLE